MSPSLHRLAQGIAHPRSYFRGVGTTPAADLPANIICFVRRHERELGHPDRGQTQHHRHMLIVLLEGAGDVCLDARIFPVRQGQALLVHPFQFHSYIPAKGPLCWVFLTFEGTEEARWENTRPRHALDLQSAEWVLLEECLRLWKKQTSDPILLQYYLGTLLASLQQHPGRAGRSSRRAMTDEKMKILTEINRQAMTLIRQPAGLKTLAATLGRSESNLRKKFRELTGVSLGKHIRELRVMRACSDLHRTTSSVGEVAEACGFDSIYSFSRTFKDIMGVSPARYRRALRARPVR